MTYNEYWQVIDAGYKPEQLVVFKYEDQGVATLEDGLYVMEDKLKDPAFVDKMARFVKASMKGWAYARAHGDEAVKIVLDNDFDRRPDRASPDADDGRDQQADARLGRPARQGRLRADGEDAADRRLRPGHLQGADRRLHDRHHRQGARASKARDPFPSLLGRWPKVGWGVGGCDDDREFSSARGLVPPPSGPPGHLPHFVEKKGARAPLRAISSASTPAPDAAPRRSGRGSSFSPVDRGWRARRRRPAPPPD